MSRSVRLDGLFRLLSPLSHIAESISTTAYLVEEPILQDDGTLGRVFVYSGNAWRGQLRDLSASYMLEAIGAPRLGLDAFHLLFSGGRIGGAQTTDLAQARRLRSLMPHLALFGGGVGNQILAGKFRVGSAYPVCAEAARVLPHDLRDRARAIPYAGLTFEKSYSRRDDAKIEGLAVHLAPPDPVLLDHGAPRRGKGKKGEAGAAGPEPEATPQQMRMTSELLAAGVDLYTWIEILDADDVTLGCLVAALHAFAASPHIGGQSARGHGRVEVSYALHDEGGTREEFVAVEGGRPRLSARAEAAKSAYDEHLRRLYDAHLADNSAGIVALLGAA